MSGPGAAAGVDLVAAVRGGRLLVSDGASGPVLPRVEDSDGWLETPKVVATAGVASATVLAPATRLGGEPTTTVHLLGLPLAGPDPSIADASWLDVDDLDRLAHPPAVAAAIRTGLVEYARDVPWPPGRPAWYRPSWPAELDGWVDEQLPRLGLTRTGGTVAVKVWSLSAVVRIPVVSGTGATSVYVKATCEHFRAEPAVTRLLASLAPEVVPDVLAIDETRGWILMRPFTDGDGDDAERPETAPVAAFEQLVSGGLELALLNHVERQQAVALLPWVAREHAALAAVGVPDSLAHGDLHLANYVADSAGVRIFDWSDAALACPVLDALMLAHGGGLEHEQATFDAYAEVWAEHLPEVDVAAALRLAAVPHLVYLAVSFEGIYRDQEQQSRWEMAGICARLLRRLILRWTEAGSPS
ncbi:phosphotransferase family protein [uncultured Friedmanniella sp.]|uniref:phosphotransferase family protein n=1 Tax=uncultured Friedmanniella sp. TaxID=335381 RepID=UPI0035CA75E6